MTVDEARDINSKLSLAAKQVALFTKQLMADGYTVCIKLDRSLHGIITMCDVPDAEVIATKTEEIRL